jgi:hypothetical protein
MAGVGLSTDHRCEEKVMDEDERQCGGDGVMAQDPGPTVL